MNPPLYNDVRVGIGVGSLLLLPEVLGKPLRDAVTAEVRILAGFLSRLDLRPVDPSTAAITVTLASAHRLCAADATHLATAGADPFITNNSRDLPRTMTEIDVVYPSELPDISG